MIAAEAEAKFSSAAPSSIFLERNSPSEGGIQVVSRETSQQMSYRFSV